MWPDIQVSKRSILLQSGFRLALIYVLVHARGDTCLQLGMGSALETLCGQAYGAAQHHMLGVYLQRAFLVLFITCLPLSFFFLYMEDILKLVGQDPEVAEKAGEYAFYLLPNLFAYVLLQPMVKFLQVKYTHINTSIRILLHISGG